MKKMLGLVTILIILVIYACKKEIATSPISSNGKSLSVVELKESLIANTEGYSINSDDVNSNVRELNWLKTYSLKLKDGSNILSVPLTRNMDDYINGIQKRLVARKDSLGKIQKEIMVARPDEEYLKSNNGGAPLKTFTGKILFYSTDNVFSRGYVLENGKIIGQLNVVRATTIDKEQDPQKTQGWTEDCEWRKMGYVVENGVLNIWYAKFCMWKYTESYLPPEQTIDWIEPEPPYGAYTWQEKESKRFNITDSLDAFPCAKNLVAEMPNFKGKIATLINDTFGNNADMNIRFVPFVPGDPLKDGESIVSDVYPFGNGLRYYGIIKINEEVLKYATQEYILCTMYHEALHAFLYVELLKLGPEGMITKYPRINPEFVYGPAGGLDMTKAKFIDEDHTTMGMYFSVGLKKLIKEFNPNISDSTATAMAQSGIIKQSPRMKTLYHNERNVRDNNYKGKKCP